MSDTKDNEMLPAHAPGMVIDEEPGEMALEQRSVASEVSAEQVGIYSEAQQPAEVPAEPKEPEVPARRPAAPDASNVRQDYLTFRPADKDTRYTSMMYLPSGTPDQINVAIDLAPNVRLDDTTETREWARSLNSGTDISMIGDVFGDSVLRADAMWAQNVRSDAGLLEAKSPEFKDSPGLVLTGERAILRMRHLLGQGSVFQIPLWHSGFWVALKAPSEGALLELDRRLSMEKINLGRTVHGVAFSNHNVYIVGWLVEFALNHIYDVSVEGWGQEDLRKHIKSLDIPTLLWGLSSVIWMDGFPYSQACAAQPEKCNNVIKELVDISKLHWTDNRALSPWQVAHMAGRNTKAKPDSILKYQDEFVRGRPRRVNVDDKVDITLRLPSVEQYLDSGNRWVAGIVNMVDKAFQLDPDDGARNAYIDEQGKATTMRQFGHMVEEIHFPNDNNIKDRETIEMALSELSSREGLVDRYLEEIGKFINDSTISVVAIPAHECPVCGTPREGKMPRFPQLLPIDIASTFFILLVQKVQAIRDR